MPIPANHATSFYAVDISKFQDSNGDGIGDLPGVIQRLDYLAELGVSHVWVLPFFPSSGRDNGYDIIDYYQVDPTYGTLDDFRTLLREAHRRNLRIIIDLVAHHTSDQHPWFQAARADRSSPYRDYYVWSPVKPTENQPKSIFPGPEKDVWTWDEVAGEYFFHRFYHFQPDLNFANPHVQDEFIAVARYWMNIGVDGFRIDAANHLFEEKGIPGTAIDDPCVFIRRLRSVVDELNPEAVLVAEADVTADAIAELACAGDGMDLFLNFLLNNQLFLGLTRELATPVADGLRELPQMPDGSQWLNFLRNLDEIDLERLEDDERAEVFERFAPDEDMRIYGRGIRRRLAPLLDGEKRRARMLFSLLFALPGAPLVVYGDEIGLGDDLRLPERMSVHLPMQWSDDYLGGFTSANEATTGVAPIADGAYGYKKVNVAAQLKDPESLLNLVAQLHRCRSAMSNIWMRPITFETLADGRVLRVAYDGEEGSLETFHNFSKRREIGIQPGLSEEFEPVMADSGSTIEKDGLLTLGPYGFCWLLSSRANPIPESRRIERLRFPVPS